MGGCSCRDRWRVYRPVCRRAVSSVGDFAARGVGVWWCLAVGQAVGSCCDPRGLPSVFMRSSGNCT